MSRGLSVGENPSSSAETELSDTELLARFAARRDEGAFRTLVERHGPMVFDVCRRVLGDAHAAEDAFQATFLLLARKAPTLGQPALTGNWLYGTAYRIAAKARVQAARRRVHERRAATMPPVEPRLELAWRELRAVLDQELNELPDKYRDALVLCYLQGKTNDQAAELLGCPAGSMSWRLAHGRELLRKRLTRRGLALSAGILALLLSWCFQLSISHRVVESTVEAALAAAGGELARVSGSALALVESAGEANDRPRVLQGAQLLVAILAFLVLGAAVASWFAFDPLGWLGPRPAKAATAPPDAKDCPGHRAIEAAPLQTSSPRLESK